MNNDSLASFVGRRNSRNNTTNFENLQFNSKKNDSSKFDKLILDHKNSRKPSNKESNQNFDSKDILNDDFLNTIDIENNRKNSSNNHFGLHEISKQSKSRRGLKIQNNSNNISNNSSNYNSQINDNLNTPRPNTSTNKLVVDQNFNKKNKRFSNTISNFNNNQRFSSRRNIKNSTINNLKQNNDIFEITEKREDTNDSNIRSQNSNFKKSNTMNFSNIDELINDKKNKKISLGIEEIIIEENSNRISNDNININEIINIIKNEFKIKQSNLENTISELKKEFLNERNKQSENEDKIQEYNKNLLNEIKNNNENLINNLNKNHEKEIDKLNTLYKKNIKQMKENYEINQKIFENKLDQENNLNLKLNEIQSKLDHEKNNNYGSEFKNKLEINEINEMMKKNNEIINNISYKEKILKQMEEEISENLNQKTKKLDDLEQNLINKQSNFDMEKISYENDIKKLKIKYEFNNKENENQKKILIKKEINLLNHEKILKEKEEYLLKLENQKNKKNIEKLNDTENNHYYLQNLEQELLNKSKVLTEKLKDIEIKENNILIKEKNLLIKENTLNSNENNLSIKQEINKSNINEIQNLLKKIQNKEQQILSQTKGIIITKNSINSQNKQIESDKTNISNISKNIHLIRSDLLNKIKKEDSQYDHFLYKNIKNNKISDFENLDSGYKYFNFNDYTSNLK